MDAETPPPLPADLPMNVRELIEITLPKARACGTGAVARSPTRWSRCGRVVVPHDPTGTGRCSRTRPGRSPFAAPRRPGAFWGRTLAVRSAYCSRALNSPKPQAHNISALISGPLTRRFMASHSGRLRIPTNHWRRTPARIRTAPSRIAPPSACQPHRVWCRTDARLGQITLLARH
jgi:hypothetical protein